MRSSIACARCRRSKVKCVNNGPNTMCKACENGNRDCTYPAPGQPGNPRSGTAATGGLVMGSGSHGGSGTTGNERSEAPKKPKVKKPPCVPAPATTATVNTPKYWRECLESAALTQPVWKLIFDAFQLHHSPLLPFLHPPTFLNRLRASAPSTSSSGSSPPAPEKPHSPLLLLGMLALTGRHIPALVTQALTTPTAVSEFYAAALKYRLKNDEEDDLFNPTLEKLQALLMLSVHEWGQARAPEAYMWLGLAIRMSGRLQLTWVDDGSMPEPNSPDPDLDGPSHKRRKLGNGTSVKSSMASTVDKEIRRRTFWSVFILDRTFASTRGYPSGVSSTEASRVQLPCEERGFMFGTSLQSGYLCPNELLNTRRNGEMMEAGGEERILAQIVKVMEIFGKIQEWADIPNHVLHGTNSDYHRLSTALDLFVGTLPQQLEFSLDTLQVHTSTQSSSAYTVLHTTLFLARMTLESRYLSDVPLSQQEITLAPTTEDQAFIAASRDRLFSSARDFVTLMSGLKEWNADLHNPLILRTLYKVARLGVYAFNFPWTDQSGYLTGYSLLTNAKGTSEEVPRTIEWLIALKTPWHLAEVYFAELTALQQHYTDQKDAFLRQNPATARDTRYMSLLANNDEGRQLLSLLAPPATPKTQAANVHDLGRNRSNSDVETMLLATEKTPTSASASTTAKAADGWAAVNKPPPPTQQIRTSPPGKILHHHQQPPRQPQQSQPQPQQSQSQPQQSPYSPPPHPHHHSRTHSHSKELAQRTRSPSTPIPPQQQNYTLDTLAGYAAQHGKLSNHHPGSVAATIESATAKMQGVTLPPPASGPPLGQQTQQWAVAGKMHPQHQQQQASQPSSQPQQQQQQREREQRWEQQQSQVVVKKEKNSPAGSGSGSGLAATAVAGQGGGWGVEG